MFYLVINAMVIGAAVTGGLRLAQKAYTHAIVVVAAILIAAGFFGFSVAVLGVLTLLATWLTTLLVMAVRRKRS